MATQNENEASIPSEHQSLHESCTNVSTKSSCGFFYACCGFKKTNLMNNRRQRNQNHSTSSCLRMPSSKLDSENLVILSLVQLLCGSAAIVLFGVTLTKQGHLHEAGTGLWSGCLMLASGCLGLVASRYRRQDYYTNSMSPFSQNPSTPNSLSVSASSSSTVLCILVTLLVICVLATIASTVLSALSIAGLIQDGLRDTKPTQLKLHLIVLHTLLFIVGFLETCVAIATAILCARQVCFSAIYLPAANNYRFSANSGSNNNLSFYCPPNDNHRSLRRRGFLLQYSRNRRRSQTDVINIPNPLSNLANLLPNRPHESSSSIQPLSHLIGPGNSTQNSEDVIARHGQHPQSLPVLATNSYYADVLFQSRQVNEISSPTTSDNGNNCRTSLIYLSSYGSPVTNENPSTLVFPPFPPCYSINEARPLSAYACMGNGDAASDTILQPALLIEEDPPPYIPTNTNEQDLIEPRVNLERDDDVDTVILIDTDLNNISINTSTSSISNNDNLAINSSSSLSLSITP